MKPRIIFATIVLLAGGCRGHESQHDGLTLWYTAPARFWEETLPLGNGRLGAMPDGGIGCERIVLNEITMWSGSEEDASNPGALRHLPQIRQLLLQGRNSEAQELMFRHFTCRGGGSESPRYGCYQTLGELTLGFDTDTACLSGYERGLSLPDAAAYTRFESGGIRHERTCFVSRTADVVAVRLRTSGAGKLNFTVSLTRPENRSVACEGDTLVMRGTLPSGVAGKPGVGYVAKSAVQCRGGVVESGPQQISVRGADEAVIYLSAATTYWGRDCEREADSLLRRALESDFDRLLAEHSAEHRRYFDRVSLDLGPGRNELPTDERLKHFDTTSDPAFAALYMQYGRYLLISSTREGSLPPNLQGLWAQGVTTPWNGDYHLNINVEMNHWLTGPGNLAELQLPLVDYTERLVPSGERTARSFYGTGGWCAHVLANAWNFTAPAENPAWGATNTGGAWLALHLWEQYRFTADTACLRRIYPVLRGAAEFFLGNLIPEPGHGWLVTAPTTSPENSFYTGSHKRATSVCMGSTMDTQIVRELFAAVCKASETLGTDKAFAARLRETSRRLPPHRVNGEGRLMEWLEDYEETDSLHRHVSHLFGLYPGTQLTRGRTPELMEACRRTLDRRGDGGTGWSRAWKICFRARLGDGDRAYGLLKSLLAPVTVPGGEGWQGGTYPNLLCAHPPFQIDGNLGGAAGIAEMLLQSHDGCIEVLPARPAAWTDGEYRGLKARGNVTVGCRWREGRVREVTLHSTADSTFLLRIPDRKAVPVTCRAGQTERLMF